MSTVIEKAIQIAVDTFLSDYSGSAVDVYTRLKNENTEHWSEVDYVTVWSPFENSMCVSEVTYAMSTLIDDIIRNFKESA